MEYHARLRMVTLVPLGLFFLLLTEEVKSLEGVDLCDPVSISNHSIEKYEMSERVNCNCTNCIRKCCAYGFYFSFGKCWRYNETNPNSTFVLPVFQRTKLQYEVRNASRFSFGMNLECSTDILIPLKDADEVFYVQEDGELWMAFDDRTVSIDSYCVEDTAQNGRVAFACESTAKIWAGRISTFGLLISIPFLFATFVVFACVPKRSTHMKAVMCYVLTYAVALIFMMFDRLYQGSLPPKLCVGLGYVSLTFLITSFYWMNVICLDMWLNFRSFQGLLKSKTRENQFLYYCAYVFCITVIHVGTMILIDNLKDPEEWYHPRFGVGSCSLRRGWPRFLYLYFPMTVIIVFNLVLFVLTAIGIWKVKQDSKKFEKSSSRKHSYDNQRTEFHLFIKLLLAMGVNWSLEIISFFVNWKVKHVPLYLWYLTDFSNSVYGLILFLIFVVKKTTWKSLKERYCSVKDMLSTNIPMRKTTPSTSCSEIYTKKETA